MSPDSAEPMSKQAIDTAQRKLALDIEGDHFHPLEAIRFFRRWPRSLARNIIYTLLFNALFALGFTLIGLLNSRVGTASALLEVIGSNLLISNLIGFAFWGVFEVIGPITKVVNRQHFLIVALFYTVVGTIIVTACFYAVTYLPGYAGMRRWVLTPQQVFTSFIVSLCISLVLAVIWRRRLEELATQIALAEERRRVEAAERAAAEANLRALQAQIEPHFLFNTLANVTGLIHPQPDTAKLMLEKFIDYLRSTLASTRERQSTLADEFELMSNFLAILQIRMGDRLHVELSLPDDLAAAAIPPMLLQPLVENAIKHGLEPKVEGGSIRLQAERAGDAIHLSVIDTGVGFTGGTSNGIGLRNVRERLQQLFGDRGRLVIEENIPAGTRVVLTIPAT
jgi:sensor histidine kinase YesM